MLHLEADAEFSRVRETRRHSDVCAEAAGHAGDARSRKRINDTDGHQIGDMVLRELGDRFRRCIRASDTVGRYGGEEYVYVGTVNCEDVEEIAKRVWREVRDQSFDLDDLHLDITISAEFSCIEYDDLSATSSSVRRWPLSAKSAGRDQVFWMQNNGAAYCIARRRRFQRQLNRRCAPHHGLSRKRAMTLPGLSQSGAVGHPALTPVVIDRGAERACRLRAGPATEECHVPAADLRRFLHDLADEEADQLVLAGLVLGSTWPGLAAAMTLSTTALDAPRYR